MSCILCEIGLASNHPSHPEAPRCGDKDYEQLWTKTRPKAKTHSPYAGQCIKCRDGQAKRMFPSEASARRHARDIGKPFIHEYYCTVCDHWHVGSQERVGA